MSKSEKIILAVIVAAVVIAVSCVILYFTLRNRNPEKPDESAPVVSEEVTSGSEEETGEPTESETEVETETESETEVPTETESETESESAETLKPVEEPSAEPWIEIGETDPEASEPPTNPNVNESSLTPATEGTGEIWGPLF